MLIGAPCWTQKYPFYALGIIAGIARDSGVSCIIYDMNIEFYSYLIEDDKKKWDDNIVTQWAGDVLPAALIKEHRNWINEYLSSTIEDPNIKLVCFSVNTYTRYFSNYAAAFIKSIQPELPIMFGGVDCFIGEHNKKFLTEKNCDIICQGEGEICFRDYLEEFRKTGDYRNNVKGFAYLNRDGSLTDNGEPELPKLRDRDVPLPDYSQFDFSKYTEKGSVPLFSSRGCINRCNFCSESPNFKYFRFRKAENIFNELKHTYSYAIKVHTVPTFHFADSLVNGNIKELEKFCDMIIESGLVIKWGGQAAIRPQMTSSLLEKMARSGFSSFFWGMESASANVLKLMNKPNDIALFERILKDCNKFGITNNTPTIVGYPGETPQDVAVTLNFILKNRKRTCFTLPGLALARKKSPLYDRYSEFGLKEAREYAWETVDGKNTIQVRVFRRFLFFQACFNESFSLDNLVDYEEIAPLDMNAQVVAKDYINILYELARMTGTTGMFKIFLRTLSNMPDGITEITIKPSLVGSNYQKIKRQAKILLQLVKRREEESEKVSKTSIPVESDDLADDFKKYFNLNKNTRQGRLIVYKLTLDIFKAVYESTCDIGNGS
ncbi:MAG: hypothetical protein A2Y10_05810 [Planctomycetes bacterium GWF2_41_51]|nr:MAG: hypothetical protein A2Y10_05810 [Planctomycetes bacterium GWF2_41_51]